MSTAIVPYNRFAHTLEGGQLHRATFDAPSQPLPPHATFQHDAKQIKFHNIADGNLLQVGAPSVEGAPDMKMDVKKTGRNEYTATYKPDGYTYRVNAAYGGKMLQGFPVTMAAKAPHLVNDIPGRKFVVHNVYQPDLLSVHTATLAHKASYDPKARTVTVEYQPQGGFHEVHVQYKDQDMPNSRFQLSPKPKMVAPAPMMYQAQGYMGGYPMVAAAPAQYAQQPMMQAAAPMQYGQPMQAYAQPMQAAPAHMMQAGAPMMMQGAPTLMAQPMMQAGHAPMMMQPAAVQQQQQQPAGYYAPYPQLK